MGHYDEQREAHENRISAFKSKQAALDYCASNGYRYRPEFSLTRNAEIAATEGKMDVSYVFRSVKDE